MFELNTSIHTLRDLTNTDLAPYDAIYLGNPYCHDDEDNLLRNIPDLKEAIARLQSKGVKAYVSTDCLPRNSDLPSVDKTLETAASMGADAIEVQNMGVLLRARKLDISTPIHLGCMFNLYTPATVALLSTYGVKRAMGSYELSLTELKGLMCLPELEIQILLHGKMVLGVGESDLICQRAIDELASLKRQFKSHGRAIISGKDVCMLEHLRDVLHQGFRLFRIEILPEQKEYVSAVGRTYRRAFNTIISGEKFSPSKSVAELKLFSQDGFCNGYYFGIKGEEYVTIDPI